MNILYITAMHGAKHSGITTAVPKHIESQASYDSVFWYNVIELSHEIENCSVVCHTISEYPELDISKLPDPFNQPDLVVYEDFYYPQFLKLAKQIIRLNIPYVIVPHCCFCTKAQGTKGIKKKIANVLLFNRFAHGASAIHYLTEREMKDSGVGWNKNYFILPNGAEIPKTSDIKKKHNKLIGSFIGRLDVFQKGLDLLVEAVAPIKDVMLKNNCIINIYGADCEGNKNKLMKLIESRGVQDILTVNSPVYEENKRDVLLKSDFFILTSRYEGHPMGLIEALAYGIPSLVTYETNMGEEIEKFDAGWVCECTTMDIKKALLKMLSETFTFEEKGKNGIRLARQFNWNTIAAKAHRIYEGIVAR